MENTFTHTNILKIFPTVKVRSMISWSERGLIKPLQDASGRGSSRAYSYTNVMEIGIISELLRYGLPYFHIYSIMKSEEMKNLLKKGMWDNVFWFSSNITWAFRVLLPGFSFGITPVDEFLQKGGELIMSVKGGRSTAEGSGTPIERVTDPVELQSSAIIVNVSTLKRYVDYMITKL